MLLLKLILIIPADCFAVRTHSLQSDYLIQIKMKLTGDRLVGRRSGHHRQRPVFLFHTVHGSQSDDDLNTATIRHNVLLWR